MRPVFIAFCTAALLAVACTPRERTVVILSTNDMHAAIENFPRLATAVERCRDTADVILVDAGDRWTGNAYVDHAAEPGKPIIELMNDLGYDAATFGNHEFDRGLLFLAERTADADFAVVCANLQSDTSAFPQPDPYVIIERGGLKIGFVGLVTNFIDGHPDGQAANFEGLTFPSPFETAVAWEKLAEECDLLVALTHIGDGMDRRLAEEAPAYELIIGGHTHTVIDPGQLYGNSLITQTGKSLKYVGATVVTMRGDELVELSNRLVPLADYPPSPEYEAKVARYHDNPALKEPIGTNVSGLDRTGLANFITGALLEETDADLALYHFGGIRMDTLPAGGVSMGDIYTLEPFSSTVYVVRMTEGDLREMIVRKFNDTKNPKESHRPDLHPAGMRYTILTDAAGEAIDVRFEGIEPGEVYEVALGDYIFKNYDFNRSRGYETEEELITDVLIEYMEDHDPIDFDNRERIVIR